MANSLRDTRKWRNGRGDIESKLANEFGKVAYSPVSPGIMVVGAVGTAIANSTPVAITTGLSTVMGYSHSVATPTTPAVNINIKLGTSGNLVCYATPACTISWMAFGI